MGRGKLPLKLIEKERARRITCVKRKKGLVKKAYELSVLCDVRVCLIIFDSADSDVKTWPEQPQQVDRIVADYLSYKAKNPSAKRDLTISDFFNDRIKKLKQQNEKLLKQADHQHQNQHDHHNNHQDHPFPLSDSLIEQLSDHDLIHLLDRLDAKIEAVRKLRSDRAANLPLLLDQPSSSNQSNALQCFTSFDHHQTTPFDLNSCYTNFPYYTNLLEGGMLTDSYGSGFPVPEVCADEVYGGNGSNDHMVSQFLKLLEPFPMTMQSGFPVGMSQYHYYSPAEPPLYLMDSGGPILESDDHKFVDGTSHQEDVKNLFYETMDFGLGKAPLI